MTEEENQIDLSKDNSYEVSIRLNSQLASDVSSCLRQLTTTWKELQIIKERAEHESKCIEESVRMLRKYYPFGMRPPWEDRERSIR